MAVEQLRYFLFICETNGAKSSNGNCEASAPRTYREHQRHSLVVLILCTKAREWSNQRRSKHAFSTLLSALEVVGPMRRPVPRLFLSQFPKRSDVVPDHVSRSLRKTPDRCAVPHSGATAPLRRRNGPERPAKRVGCQKVGMRDF